MRDAAPPKGHAVETGHGVFALSLGRPPRRGARRAKPVAIAHTGAYLVRWSGGFTVMGRVWWDAETQTYSCDQRGVFMAGWRAITPPNAEGLAVVSLNFGDREDQRFRASL